MTKRDQIILKKIQAYQKILSDTIKELRISSSGDLDSVHPMMRRGMVQTVADIFELTNPLSDAVVEELPLNRAVIKQFRNTASHNYGQITSMLAYACIIHCIDKQFINAIVNLLNNNPDTE